MKIENYTDYDGRRVRMILNRVAKGMEVDPVLVRVIFGSSDWIQVPGTYVSWRMDLGISPAYTGFATNRKFVLIALRFKDEYPMMNTVYRRWGQNPEPWMINDWQEALVAAAAHEFQHLRDLDMGRDFHREVETEWAAFRYWRDWVEGRL